VLNTEWISVAAAASLMGVCKRQALRRLNRKNAEVGGRLLRRIGDKRMPGGVQASKYLVSTTVLREALRGEPSDVQRDIETLRLEQVLISERIEALRKLVRPLARRLTAANGT
jgi:hypothetical protein